MLATEGRFAQVPHVVSRCINSCEVMRTMLATAWLPCSREIYREKMQQQLKDLEGGDFEMDRGELCARFMAEEAKRLRHEGHVRGRHRWDAKVPRFSAEVPLSLDFAGDEYEMCYWARVRSIAVNTNQLQPLLPWELLLCPPGSAEGVPVALHLPAEVLEPLGPLRAAMHALLNENVTSLSDMCKLMRKNQSELVDCHRSAKLDLAFLEHKAEGMLKEKVGF